MDALFPVVGWRGMFVIGALPAFLVIYIRTKVDESPAWLQGRVQQKAETRMGKDVLSYLGIFVFLVVLMFAFNSFSHGTPGPVSNISSEESQLHAANSRADWHHR